jgi:hypothetical protein
MSACGTKRTSILMLNMSAFGCKADSHIHDLMFANAPVTARLKRASDFPAIMGPVQQVSVGAPCFLADESAKPLASIALMSEDTCAPILGTVDVPWQLNLHERI